jgi:RNA polymerase sigma-70 factor (ECF subfamily)
MDEKQWLADRFDANLRELRAFAEEMLGSSSEAQEAVENARFELGRSDTGGAEQVRGWLTMVVSRACVERLRARNPRHMQLAGTKRSGADVDGETGALDEDVLFGDSVSLALLIALATFSTDERLAFCCTTCSPCPWMRSLR